MTGRELEIRHCKTVEEMQACVALQQEVWNFADADLVPLRMFVVAEKVGGQVLAAYDGKETVAFLLAVPGARNGHPYLHSHMLAVKEKYRNSGLGRRMKLAQREDALARGFALIEWTFDPLEIKNAHLNVVRLGAIARRYSINQYGMSSSPLQGGLPTDRLVAEWWLKSKRVERILKGEPVMVKEELRIAVPAQISTWKASPADRARARDLQSRNREVFLKAFDKQWAVLDYQRDQEGNGTFILGKWDEDWSYATK